MIDKKRVKKGISLNQRFYPRSSSHVPSSYNIYYSENRYIFSNVVRGQKNTPPHETTVLLDNETQKIILEQFDNNTRNILSIELDSEGVVTKKLLKNQNGISKPDERKQNYLISRVLDFLPKAEETIEWFSRTDGGSPESHCQRYLGALHKVETILHKTYNPKL